MVGAGTIINPILKVVTTVAILAAVYFFIVKPSLDTTERISSGINSSVDDTNREVERALRRRQRRGRQRPAADPGGDPRIGSGDPPGGADVQIEDANRLLECIQAANGDVNQMAACQP